MSEHGRPKISQRAGPSIIWIIPLITIIVGIWLVARTVVDQLPTATITFRTAQGIEAGKTRIKYKSVDIGVVEEIKFADDFDHVILKATFNQGMEDFLRRNTRFWVVKPQLSLRGVSGLGTLISGSYIEIDPGPGSSQSHFVGLEKMPLITRDDEGVQLTLISDTLGSLGTGSPLYYQGLLAGEVLGYELGSDAQSIFMHIFVREPYSQLIKGNTRFWNVSGMDVSLDANGFDVKTASLQALLIGGIAFETPHTRERNNETEIENLIFTLYPDYEQIVKETYTRKQQFLMYFSSSVRGLSPGAPLEFKGIQIGSVLDIKLEFESESSSFRIPVLVEVEPDRIVDRDASAEISPLQTLNTLIDRGLRARLATGSLLTGQLFVELNMYPGTEAVYLGDANSPHPELPTVPGALEAMTQSIQGLMAKMEAIDVEALGGNIVGILDGVDDLVNKPKTEDTVTDLQASLRALKNILEEVDESGLDETISSANTVLTNLDTTLEMLDGVLTPTSPLQYNLIKVTGELDETARAVRHLIEILQRHPDSLIFGRPAEREDKNTRE
ncbi:MAG: MlaD family protein [Pseudomonadales bacterium]